MTQIILTWIAALTFKEVMNIVGEALMNIAVWWISERKWCTQSIYIWTEVNCTSKIRKKKSKNLGLFELEGLRQPSSVSSADKDLRGRHVPGFYSSCCVFCSYNWLPFICWRNNEPLQHYLHTHIPCSGLKGSSAAFIAISGVLIPAIRQVLLASR